MTSDLAVVVPSRSRPKNIDRLALAWLDTEARADLIVVVDSDDPALHQYKIDSNSYLLLCGPRKGIGATWKLNDIATQSTDRYRYIGFMGDDVVPRTKWWDLEITTALDKLGTGIVYPNDMYQGERLPTAAFLTSDIIATLGYMVPPSIKHLYMDNVWLTWGKAIGRITYLPNVILEHLHPVASKGDWDDVYQEGNSDDMASDCKEAYETYLKGPVVEDVRKLRALCTNQL
jgi:hypothetical protein